MGALPESVSKMHGNGAQNLMGAIPFPCILVINLPTQNGREPTKVTEELSKYSKLLFFKKVTCPLFKIIFFEMLDIEVDEKYYSY